eukprot:6182822-Ditylum_brightwellii.AAC.1
MSTNIAISSNGTYMNKTPAGVLNVNLVQVSNIPMKVEQKFHAAFTVGTNGRPEMSNDSDKKLLAQAVDYVEFLDTIVLNHDPNNKNRSVDIDIDAIKEYIDSMHNLYI